MPTNVKPPVGDPECEYFAAGDSGAIRRRCLLTKAEFSQAVREGRLRQVDQHPRLGIGYRKRDLDAVTEAAKSKIIFDATGTPNARLAATATVFARRDGRDQPTEADVALARQHVNSTPAERSSISAGYHRLHDRSGRRMAMRMHSSGKKSAFYAL